MLQQLTLLVSITLLVACGAESTTPSTTTSASAKDSDAAAALYRCPMHTDQVSTDPTAKCPVCGMDLEKVQSK